MQQIKQSDIDRVLAGEHDAYRVVVERYHVGLLIYCEHLVNDRATAEDMTQQAFINAYDKLYKFDATKASFSTWLYRIARNLCIDYLRLQKQVAHYDPEDFEDEAPIDSLGFDEIESIRVAVNGLEPPIHALAVKAYYWQGLSYKQIAEEHNTTVNTVASWIRRAKADLRKELA